MFGDNQWEWSRSWVDFQWIRLLWLQNIPRHLQIKILLLISICGIINLRVEWELVGLGLSAFSPTATVLHAILINFIVIIIIISIIIIIVIIIIIINIIIITATVLHAILLNFIVIIIIAIIISIVEIEFALDYSHFRVKMKFSLRYNPHLFPHWVMEGL